LFYFGLRAKKCELQFHRFRIDREEGLKGRVFAFGVTVKESLERVSQPLYIYIYIYRLKGRVFAFGVIYIYIYIYIYIFSKDAFSLLA
jgi:hypothetical protein